MRIVAAALVMLATAAQAQEPARFAWFDYSGADAPLGRAGAGDYANPILGGFYPDPSITRVGDEYYLVNSSFSYFPGLPVFRSRDLVHWTQIGNAIDRPGQLDFTGLGMSRGIFAPAITHHAGAFYIVNTCVECGGNFVITAKDPAGPWSDPVWLKDVGGIDPSLFVDTDGSAWLVNNDVPAGKILYEGHRAIWMRRFDLKALKTAGPAKMIVDGGLNIAAKPVWVEGPHVFRKDGRYYLIAAEGGTGAQHSETVYRADRPDGPYVGYPRPILTQRDLDPARADPITSTGHAGFVETARGQWWSTFLGVRPYRGDLYNTGRETFLLPVTWKDGWPFVTRPGQNVPYAHRKPDLPADTAPLPLGGNFTVRDAFDAPTLARYWVTARTPKTRWWRLAGGDLVIEPRPARIGEVAQPSFLGRRQAHMNAVASTELRFDDRTPGAKAGLVAYQDEAHYWFVGVVNRGGRRVVSVERRGAEGDSVDGVAAASAPIGVGTIRLRISARGGAYDFAYARPGRAWRTLLAGADGTNLSTAVAGGFTGTVIGPFAYRP